MTTYELLTAASQLSSGTTYQHLDNIGNGVDTWAMLLDASNAPDSSTAWVHLNNLVTGAPLRPKFEGLRRHVGRLMR